MTKSQLNIVGEKIFDIRLRLVSLPSRRMYDVPDEVMTIDQMLENLYNTIKAMELPVTVETESGDE